jgi:hypothetical protein
MFPPIFLTSDRIGHQDTGDTITVARSVELSCLGGGRTHDDYDHHRNEHDRGDGTDSDDGSENDDGDEDDDEDTDSMRSGMQPGRAPASSPTVVVNADGYMSPRHHQSDGDISSALPAPISGHRQTRDRNSRPNQNQNRTEIQPDRSGRSEPGVASAGGSRLQLSNNQLYRFAPPGPAAAAHNSSSSASSSSSSSSSLAFSNGSASGSADDGDSHEFGLAPPGYDDGSEVAAAAATSAAATAGPDSAHSATVKFEGGLFGRKTSYDRLSD